MYVGITDQGRPRIENSALRANQGTNWDTEGLRRKEGSELSKPRLLLYSIAMDPAVAHAAEPASDGSHAPRADPHANLHSEDAASLPPLPQVGLPNSKDLHTLQPLNPDTYPADLIKEAPHAPVSVEVAPSESNPYIARLPADNSSSSKSTDFALYCISLGRIFFSFFKLVFDCLEILEWLGTTDTVKSALKRWGKKLGESAKKAEDLSKNTWQHCE